MATSTPAPTSTAAPFGITPPSLPAVPDISTYVGIASQQLNTPGFQGIVDAQTNQANVIQQNTASTVASLQGSTSLLQKTYGDLSNEFTVEQQQEDQQAEQTGTARVGAAKAANAAAGVTNAQGSFAAPVTGAQNDLTSSIAEIADKYGAKQTDIADTLASNLQQVQQQIVQAQNDGNTQYAAALTNVASLKYQQQQQIVDLAQQMQSAQTTYEQNTWKDYMDVVSAQHQSDTLDIMNEKLGVELKQDAGPQKTTNNAGGLGFTDKNGNPIDAATYAKQTGQDLISVMSQSKDPTDQAFVSEYNQWQAVIQNPNSPGSQSFLSNHGVTLSGSTSPSDIKNIAQASLSENFPDIGAITLP